MIDKISSNKVTWSVVQKESKMFCSVADGRHLAINSLLFTHNPVVINTFCLFSIFHHLKKNNLVNEYILRGQPMLQFLANTLDFKSFYTSYFKKWIFLFFINFQLPCDIEVFTTQQLLYLIKLKYVSNLFRVTYLWSY